MTDFTIDPDAVIWSAPESERAGRPLLVLLHGYGSHEGDLFGLAPHLPLGPVVASLRAPIAESGGFAWFPRGETSAPQVRQDAANASARAVLAWLDSTLSTSVGLLGFSQGGAMTLQLMRHAPARFAYGVQLSGFLIDGELPGDAELAERRPPVFWGRGTADQVIASDWVARTAAWLPAHSTLTERIYEGLPHAISQPELADIHAFLSGQPA